MLKKWAPEKNNVLFKEKIPLMFRYKSQFLLNENIVYMNEKIGFQAFLSITHNIGHTETACIWLPYQRQSHRGCMQYEFKYCFL